MKRLGVMQLSVSRFLILIGILKILKVKLL
jgi:hypothetical protein